MATKAKRAGTRLGLQEIVGEQTYNNWLDMLRRLVPEGRTHRLAPMIAGMLQYATVIAEDKHADQVTEGSIARKLISALDECDQKGVLPIVESLFKDAHVEYERVSRSGQRYSVAVEAAEDFLRWFNMPWE